MNVSFELDASEDLDPEDERGLEEDALQAPNTCNMASLIHYQGQVKKDANL